MALLIGICGRRHSGKSTSANHLVANHGFTPVGMPDPIKAMLRAIGLNERELNGDLKEVPCARLGGRTPRYAMEHLGETWGRQMIDLEIWTTLCKYSAAERIKFLRDCSVNVLLDSIRNPEEANLVLENGGHVIRIFRPDTDSPGMFPSERLIDECRYSHSVMNTGAESNLIANVEAFVSSLSEVKPGVVSAQAESFASVG